MGLFLIGEGFLIALAARRAVPAGALRHGLGDGAGPVARFVRVTLPLMAPALLLMARRDTILSFQATFVPALHRDRGGPASVRHHLPAAVHLPQRVRVPALRVRLGGDGAACSCSPPRSCGCSTARSTGCAGAGSGLDVSASRHVTRPSASHGGSASRVRARNHRKRPRPAGSDEHVARLRPPHARTASSPRPVLSRSPWRSSCGEQPRLEPSAVSASRWETWGTVVAGSTSRWRGGCRSRRPQ